VSRRRKWLAVSAKIILVVTVVAACRTDAPAGEQSTEVVPAPTEAGEEEPDDIPPTAAATATVAPTAVVESTPTSPPTLAPTLTPTPAPLKELVICIGQEPESLYPYGQIRPSEAAEHVLQGLYENLYTSLSYDYQARGLEKIPSLADGDAVLAQVTVGEGEFVFTASEDVVRLAEGVTVKDFDGQEVKFSGEPLTMAQLTVNFSLQPMVWSDGTPVTAEDSVYSFKLAADASTPVPKRMFERTASYEATGELTVSWTGIPGYLPADYFTNVWKPYPRHYWGGLSAAELLDADISNRRPLSSGPYKLAEWVEGDHITLTRNEYYYRAGEGWPKIDLIRFTFVPNSSQLIAQLLSGQCDIGTHDGLGRSEAGLLLEAESSGLLVPYFQTGTVFEHIDFGINSVEEYALTRPDWFQNPRIRQAITMCTDRQAMVDEIMFGRTELIDAYVPRNHPLYPADASEWPYDVAQANAVLDSLYYRDTDEDGIREDPGSGAPFKVKLLGALGNEVDEQIAEMFQGDLLQCGIAVSVSFIHSDEYFADGPDGSLFGRQFDLAAFPWLISVEPNCGLYLSSRTPGPENNWNRNYNNDTGFRNADFDAACNRALASLPGTEEYVQSHQEALRIWTEQLPIIPLFMRLKVAATGPGILNFQMDPTQSSELWNLYDLDIER
jgi:peptide/nickel transport system substrate-binding protein